VVVWAIKATNQQVFVNFPFAEFFDEVPLSEANAAVYEVQWRLIGS
jgi:hypothetical protein